MNIAGSGVIVTGGASGLGLATARLLRDAGAQVAVLDIQGPGGWDGAYHGADVSDEAAVQTAFAALLPKLPPLRAVLNAAGTGGSGLTAGPGASQDVARFRRALEVNALGAFILCTTAAQHMLDLAPDADGERGVLINVSSIVAMEGQIGTAGYAAAKGAINAMTLPLAREYASFGIRVLAIAPGIFETPMFRRGGAAAGGMVAWLEAQVQFPARPGRPEEFAAMVRHAIENPMLNGDVIRLDGAFRVPPGTREMWTG